MAGLVVPSKIYGILASGRPTVAAAPAHCEIARLLTAEEVGTVVPPEDPEKVAGAVRALYMKPQVAREMGRRARALAETRYDRHVITRRYIELFEQSLQ
jgi:glycosyltransferase involved in cell wall biosynthesis